MDDTMEIKEASIGHYGGVVFYPNGCFSCKGTTLLPWSERCFRCAAVLLGWSANRQTQLVQHGA